MALRRLAERCARGETWETNLGLVEQLDRDANGGRHGCGWDVKLDAKVSSRIVKKDQGAPLLVMRCKPSGSSVAPLRNAV